MAAVNKISISFEMYPPQSVEGWRNLENACAELRELNPHFFSVTFGAAGSSQEKTLMTVQKLIEQKLLVVPHISCVHMSTQRLIALLEQYRLLGVKRLIVVRGDPVPGEATLSDFQYAQQLIKSIRSETKEYFHITVAAYPEFHPEATNSEEDIAYFHKKIQSGANSAITQFFFNSDAFFRFKDDCYKLGVKIPIIPGILPIYDYGKLLSFSAKCGAEIPLWLKKRLEKFGHDSVSMRELGIEIVTKFCESLIAGGAEGLHFYTLNQSPVVIQICRNLR